MGIAASQFFSANDADKQTLSKRIAPSDDQMTDQRERWDALAEHLKDDLATVSGYPMQHWLQGSYKFGTQIRPARMRHEFDIDLGIYYCWAGKAEQGKYTALQFKTFVQDSLKKYALANTDDVIEVVTPAKKRCCRIRYQGSFHIDVPTYHLDADRDHRDLATQENKWEESDPKAFYEWFKGAVAEPLRSKGRRQIRYMKIWAALKFADEVKRPSSVLLTVLVTQAIVGLSDDKLASDDDALSAVLGAIVTRLDRDPSVPNPVNKKEILSDRLSKADFADFLTKLKAFQTTANNACKATELITASDIWADAFEHFFPPPEAEELNEALASRSALSKAVARITFDPVIAVTAQAQKNPNAKFSGTNQIGPIPKDCDIRFTVTNARDLPVGAEIRWMVRNEGIEAEIKNDLGHLAGTGTTQTEQSAYNGTHYMDCVVKLRGQLIGFRRVPVQVSGAAVPPRNPLKRPSYTKFR
jgi:hypothetical protein